MSKHQWDGVVIVDPKYIHVINLTNTKPNIEMQKIQYLRKYKNSQVQALLRGWSVGCGFALMDDPSLMDPPSSCTFISLSFAQIFPSFGLKYQLSFT